MYTQSENYYTLQEPEKRIWYRDKAGRQRKYEVCSESKDTSRVDRKGYFYAYYGNMVVDLDPLPVSHARLTMVEPVLFK